MDVSSKSLTAAEATYGREACYIQFDGETIPQIEPVDLIFAACVFHHIDARFHISLLSQLRSKLGTTGMLAIYEHNPWNPVTRWAVNRCEFDDDAVLITGQEMRRRLRRAGFAEPKLEYRVFFPGQLGSFRFIEPHLWWAPIGAQYVTYGMR
jgi:trans-aconitate methyltransferase